jgi:hypothetical protein
MKINTETSPCMVAINRGPSFSTYLHQLCIHLVAAVRAGTAYLHLTHAVIIALLTI